MRVWLELQVRDASSHTPFAGEEGLGNTYGLNLGCSLNLCAMIEQKRASEHVGRAVDFYWSRRGSRTELAMRQRISSTFFSFRISSRPRRLTLAWHDKTRRSNIICIMKPVSGTILGDMVSMVIQPPKSSPSVLALRSYCGGAHIGICSLIYHGSCLVQSQSLA